MPRDIKFLKKFDSFFFVREGTAKVFHLPFPLFCLRPHPARKGLGVNGHTIKAISKQARPHR